MNYNHLAQFIEVAQAGSLTQASLRLKIPKSRISRSIQSLEKELGTPLLYRTTRHVELTDAGRSYYTELKAAFESINKASVNMSDHVEDVSGLIRMTAPVDIGAFFLAPILSEFMNLYPHVTVEIILSDRLLHLVQDSVDLALRIGNLASSSLKARKLGSVSMVFVSSPRYLKNASRLQTPADLAYQRCLVFSGTTTKNKWTVLSNKGKAEVKIAPYFQSNHLEIIKNMVVAGMGVSLLPEFLCADDMASGTMVHILKEWRTEARPLQLVTPPQKNTPPKIKKLQDFLLQKLSVPFS